MNARLPPVGTEAKRRLLVARQLAADDGRPAPDEFDVMLAMLDDPEVLALVTVLGLPPDVLAGAATMLAHEREGGAIARLRSSDGPAEPRVVERARQVAAELGHPEVVPVHLLLGLGGPSDRFMGRRGWRMSFAEARDALRHLRGELPGWVPPPPASADPTPPAGDETDVDEDPAWAADWPGELRRIIPVGRAVERAGITVELLMLEVRSSVAVIHWLARTRTLRTLVDAEIHVTDDAGTSYETMQSSASGTGNHGRGQHLLVPPPVDHGTLRIEVAAFGRSDWARYPDPERAEPPPAVTGPWVFEVDLGG